MKDFEIEGLILAAGISSRFKSIDNSFNKFLLPIKDSNILTYIITGMMKSKVRKVKIIINKFSKINQYEKFFLNFIKRIGIKKNNLKLKLIKNFTPERENGYSLLLGLDNISSEYVLLSMADHVFSKNIFSRLRKKYEYYDILLATDPMYKKGYYDLNDATKVKGINSSIITIGKEKKDYNRLDMGVFIIKTKTVKEICKDLDSKFHSFNVSDVIRKAISLNLNVGYLDFPHVIWLDVDNYNIYRKVRKLFSRSSNLYPFGLNLMDNSVVNIEKKDL